MHDYEFLDLLQSNRIENNNRAVTEAFEKLELKRFEFCIKTYCASESSAAKQLDLVFNIFNPAEFSLAIKAYSNDKSECVPFFRDFYDFALQSDSVNAAINVLASENLFNVAAAISVVQLKSAFDELLPAYVSSLRAQEIFAICHKLDSRFPKIYDECDLRNEVVFFERLASGQFADRARAFHVFAQAALSAQYGISLAEFADVAIEDGLYSGTKIRRVLGEMELDGRAVEIAGVAADYAVPLDVVKHNIKSDDKFSFTKQMRKMEIRDDYEDRKSHRANRLKI